MLPNSSNLCPCSTVLCCYVVYCYGLFLCIPAFQRPAMDLRKVLLIIPIVVISYSPRLENSSSPNIPWILVSVFCFLFFIKNLLIFLYTFFNSFKIKRKTVYLMLARVIFDITLGVSGLIKALKY